MKTFQLDNVNFLNNYVLSESNNSVDDPVFGKMKYKHDWSKKEEFELFGKSYNITISAKAYSGKDISDNERKTYQKFKSNEKDVLKKLSNKIIEYINTNFDDISQYWKNPKKIKNESELNSVVKPTHFLFKQDGSMIALFECVWDTDGGFAVQVYPNWKMGTQDLFL